MIFTSLSPNTQKDDVALAIKTLFSPWNWRTGNYIPTLEQEFKNYLPTSHAIAFQSGRNALYALLKAFDVGPGDEVLVQAYTCVAVPEPILWVGAKPVYVDVLDDFTMDPISLRKRVTSKTKVIIIQHTFGTPADLDALLAVARQYGVPVIEDCAHALGGTYHGKKLGTFGDAAFFSFGRDKVISSVFGGMAVMQDAKRAEKVRSIEKSFKDPSAFYVIQQLLHPIVLTLSKKTYDVAGLGKIILEVSKRLRLTSKAVEQIEREGGKPSFFGIKYPAAHARLALHQFGKLDIYNTHRKEMVNLYSQVFTDEHVEIPIVAKNTEPVFLRYTIKVESPKDFIVRAREKGIELGDWYTESIAPKNVQYEKIGYDPEVCPRAEHLARHSLNVPTHIGLTLDDAKKVAQFICDNA